MDFVMAVVVALLVGAVIGALWSRKVTASEIWCQVNRYYIRKIEVSEYCKWMGRDFPVFNDAYRWLFWLDEGLEPTQGKEILREHRETMKTKYIDK